VARSGHDSYNGVAVVCIRDRSAARLSGPAVGLGVVALRQAKRIVVTGGGLIGGHRDVSLAGRLGDVETR
jgi:hypothetical protein